MPIEPAPQAIVLHQPRPTPVSDEYRKLFEKAKYESEHLQQIGQGKILVLTGTSKAGKTSIIEYLKETVPGSMATGMDEYWPAHDAALLQNHKPELYAKMAKALTPAFIVEAVIYDMADDRLPWKKEASEEEVQDARLTIKEARKQLKDVPLSSVDAVERQMMDQVIDESKNRPLVLFDASDSRTFLKQCAHRNFSAPVKVGLVYCPFAELGKRVAKRNEKALATPGGWVDFREPVMPLIQFLYYYRPAKQGETVIDTLTRAEVEKTFDTAFAQNLEYFSSRADKDPQAAASAARLVERHDQLKSDVMNGLGFSNREVEEVQITPKFTNFQYLFNTKVQKPADSAGIVRDWR